MTIRRKDTDLAHGGSAMNDESGRFRSASSTFANDSSSHVENLPQRCC